MDRVGWWQDCVGSFRLPAAVAKLVQTLKGEVGLPIHFHTHDTAGIACATILAAAEAGVDLILHASFLDEAGKLVCISRITMAVISTERA